MVDAALGADIEVPTLKETVKYRIPEGTQSGTVFRLKGLRHSQPPRHRARAI